jgi:hypothetical protein
VQFLFIKILCLTPLKYVPSSGGSSVESVTEYEKDIRVQYLSMGADSSGGTSRTLQDIHCSNTLELELELEFFLRPTVSRPVRLGIGPPFGTLDQMLSCSSFFLFDNFVILLSMRPL